MIQTKRKCIVCGDEYIVIDAREYMQPKTCGKRTCVSNLRFSAKHTGLDNKPMPIDLVKKWVK